MLSKEDIRKIQLEVSQATMQCATAIEATTPFSTIAHLSVSSREIFLLEMDLLQKISDCLIAFIQNIVSEGYSQARNDVIQLTHCQKTLSSLIKKPLNDIDKIRLDILAIKPLFQLLEPLIASWKKVLPKDKPKQTSSFFSPLTSAGSTMPSECQPLLSSHYKTYS